MTRRPPKTVVWVRKSRRGRRRKRPLRCSTRLTIAWDSAMRSPTEYWQSTIPRDEHDPVPVLRAHQTPRVHTTVPSGALLPVNSSCCGPAMGGTVRRIENADRCGFAPSAVGGLRKAATGGRHRGACQEVWIPDSSADERRGPRRAIRRSRMTRLPSPANAVSPRRSRARPRSHRSVGEDGEPLIKGSGWSSRSSSRHDGARR